MNPLKIITPVGSLGMGYDAARLYEGIKMGATAIIADSGSTDSGPQKLALGETMCPHDAYVDDFDHVVDAVWHHKVKALVSSAGGDGSNKHVDQFVDIIRELCESKKYRLKVVKIYAEIDRGLIKNAIDKGIVTPCGAVPDITKDEVDAATTIVAQMGLEPFVSAMQEHPDADIIIAGRAYDPAPYAGYCLSHGIEDVGIAYHMGKVMECGAHAGTPKTKEAIATIWQDRFEILPLQPHARCTPASLAAHSLYENARADFHPGPGGAIDLSKATFYEAEGRAGGSRGALFETSNPYTIKLEGAKVTGYRTIYQGSIRDPILISQIDDWLQGIQDFLKLKFKFHFDMMYRVYGKNGTMGPLEPDMTTACKEVFLLCDIRAETQALANKVAAIARVLTAHSPYSGQVATAGNFAMPITPLTISLGQIPEFNIYHLMPVSDPTELFPRVAAVYGVAQEATVQRDSNFGFDLKPLEGIQTQLLSKSNATNGGTNSPRNPGDDGHGANATHVTDGPRPIQILKLARVIRSKNAGPYEVTFDLIFSDERCFEYAQKSSELRNSVLAKLYHIDEKDILHSHFFRPALSFKFTIPRPWTAGGFGDRDVDCSQQHVPLLQLEL